MGDLTTNFSRSEFACKCGCGFDRILPSLVKQVQRFRDLLWISTGIEIPVNITSGCRCKTYNTHVGGTENSFHTLGVAADMTFNNVSFILAARMICLATNLEVMRLGAIGAYPGRNFLHLDIRTAKLTTWINENSVYRFGVDFAEEISKGARE